MEKPNAMFKIFEELLDSDNYSPLCDKYMFNGGIQKIETSNLPTDVFFMPFFENAKDKRFYDKKYETLFLELICERVKKDGVLDERVFMFLDNGMTHRTKAILRLLTHFEGTCSPMVLKNLESNLDRKVEDILPYFAWICEENEGELTLKDKFKENETAKKAFAKLQEFGDENMLGELREIISMLKTKLPIRKISKDEMFEMFDGEFLKDGTRNEYLASFNKFKLRNSDLALEIFFYPVKDVVNDERFHELKYRDALCEIAILKMMDSYQFHEDCFLYIQNFNENSTRRMINFIECWGIYRLRETIVKHLQMALHKKDIKRVVSFIPLICGETDTDLKEEFAENDTAKEALKIYHSGESESKKLVKIWFELKVLYASFDKLHLTLMTGNFDKELEQSLISKYSKSDLPIEIFQQKINSSNFYFDYHLFGNFDEFCNIVINRMRNGETGVDIKTFMWLNDLHYGGAQNMQKYLLSVNPNVIHDPLVECLALVFDTQPLDTLWIYGLKPLFYDDYYGIRKEYKNDEVVKKIVEKCYELGDFDKEDLINLPEE